MCCAYVGRPGDTDLSVSAFEDDGKCAMSDQVLPTELKLPHRLHGASEADRRVATRGPRG